MFVIPLVTDSVDLCNSCGSSTVAMDPISLIPAAGVVAAGLVLVLFDLLWKRD